MKTNLFKNSKYKVILTTVIIVCLSLIAIIGLSIRVGSLRNKLNNTQEELEIATDAISEHRFQLENKDRLIKIYKDKYELLLSVTSESEEETPEETQEDPIKETEETTVPEPIVMEAYTEVTPEEVIEPETEEEAIYEPEPVEVVYEGYIPGDTGFRSYEPYTAIGHGSIQETILWHATPDENGLMSINGRPLVAIGTGWGYWLYDEITVYTDEGSYDCIVGDIKADAHTNWTNKVTAANGCVVEFIVDPWAMDPAVKGTGSISSIPKYHGYVTDIVKTGEVNLG